jgi:hypothetical protein
LRDSLPRLPPEVQCSLKFCLQEEMQSIREDLKWKISVEKPLRNGNWAVAFFCDDHGQIYYEIIERKKEPRGRQKQLGHFKLVSFVRPGLEITTTKRAQKTRKLIHEKTTEVQKDPTPVSSRLLVQNIPFIAYPQREAENVALDPLTPSAALKFKLRTLCAFCHVLSLMHKQRCYHLGLQPDVFCTFKGSPRLMHIEYAEYVPEGCSLERTVPCVAPQYTAPECLEQIIVNPEKADMFAFGACFYAFIFSTPPFTSDEAKNPDLMREKLQKIQEQLSAAPSPLNSLIARLLSITSQDRPSANETYLELVKNIVPESELLILMPLIAEETAAIQALRKGK